MENNDRHTLGATALSTLDKKRLMHVLTSINDRTDEEARHFRQDLNHLLLFGSLERIDLDEIDSMLTIIGRVGRKEVRRTCHFE